MILCWVSPRDSRTWSLYTTLGAERVSISKLTKSFWLRFLGEIKRPYPSKIENGICFVWSEVCLCLEWSSRRSECGGGGTPCPPWTVSLCCCPLPWLGQSSLNPAQLNLNLENRNIKAILTNPAPLFHNKLRFLNNPISKQHCKTWFVVSFDDITV